MVKFIKRLKTDKIFRRNVFILYVVAVLLFSGSIDLNFKKEAPSEETCNQYNTAGYIITTAAYSSCESQGCAAQLNSHPNQWGIISDLLNFGNWFNSRLGLNTNFAQCVSRAGTGKYLLTEKIGDAKNVCVSGRASLVKSNLFSKDVYTCLSDEGEGCSSGLESSLASMLDTVWVENNMTCKTKFYIVAFGGGFLALLLIIVAI